MPNLVNHTLQYANKKLADVQANMILLGNGNTVIAQYPAENSTLVSGQRIMLLVNKENLQMPSMIGWSRKEVTAFWELTGIQVTLDGSGYVTSQSVPVGESINQETRITVKLE
ncbi:MAG: PASTA domain-containing protein [Erysipelotrichaceae bacterium]|nr:PASTA domain-containing protein [Erysipelotrichaceae bacterium]